MLRPRTSMNVKEFACFTLKQEGKKKTIILEGQEADIAKLHEALIEKTELIKVTVSKEVNHSRFLIVRSDNDQFTFEYPISESPDSDESAEARKLYKIIHDIGLISDEQYQNIKIQYPHNRCEACFPKKGTWKGSIMPWITLISSLCLAGAITSMEATKDRTDQAGKEHYGKASLAVAFFGTITVVSGISASRAIGGYLLAGCKKVGTYLTNSNAEQVTQPERDISIV